jgi:hypothetical protein
MWAQMGQLQGQLCWMQAVLNKSGIDISSATAVEADCAGAWPTKTHQGCLQCPGMGYATVYPGVMPELLHDLPSWKEAKTCLQHKVGCVPWWTLPVIEGKVIEGNLPPRLVKGCKDVLKAMGPDLAAYGRGLLYPRVDGYIQHIHDRCTKQELLAKHQLAGFKAVKRLVNGGWVVQGNTCTARANDTTDPVLPADVGSVQERVSSYGECIVQNTLAVKQLMPPSVVTDIPALLVNLLALVAIAVFVHDEVRRAVTFSHTAAAVSGILPYFYSTKSTKALNKAHLHWSLTVVLLCAPVFQLFTALMVLLSASLLSLTQENQASSIQVVLNSVALGFVLESDNKVGQMIAVQQQQWAAAGPLLCISVISMNLHGSRLRACFGHAYFAVVGLLLAIEPVMLAPHAAVMIVLGVQMLRVGIWDLDMALKSFSLNDTWSTYVALQSLFNPPPVTFGGDMFYIQNYISLTSHVVTAWYMLLVVGAVLLTFYKPLPTAAVRWPRTLLLLQALTAAEAAVVALSIMPVLAHIATACLVLCTWVCKFIIWPICHKEDASHPGPRCCCHGNCQQCCTICCSMRPRLRQRLWNMLWHLLRVKLLMGARQCRASHYSASLAGQVHGCLHSCMQVHHMVDISSFYIGCFACCSL